MMKYNNYINRFAIIALALGSVFMCHTARSKSIYIGEKVSIAPTDTAISEIKGMLFLKGNDSIGISNATIGSRYYGLNDISRIRTHRIFTARSVMNGIGLGSLAGGGISFLPLAFNDKTNYLEIIGMVVIGGWLGALIGGFVGDNVVFDNEQIYIAYDRLISSPDWIKALDCGDRLKIYTPESPTPISGSLFLKDSTYIGLNTHDSEPKVVRIDNIYEVYYCRSNMKTAIGAGLSVGALL